ncbi:MAG: iron(III) transport system permease protein [Solirubrobacterales bacterium]|jgi:iron(III) transport system permease protein|nr:iron(III) transport system permease protein [Solirubrobacterales bacterium]
MEAASPHRRAAAWPASLRWARQGRGRPPAALLVVSAAVALLALAPVGFLFDQTLSTGWDEVQRLLFRPFVGDLLVNTTTLVAVGTVACTVLGVAVAWFVERTDLPGRRAWAVLAALPITVPAFVTSYSWVSITPSVQGFWGAAGIVTLAYYPLVYLPVAAVLRGTDPALEESARSLGMGPWRTFFRVTLPQTRVALLGGILLVSVHMLSEFGAFAMLRFQTFTTAIYDQYKLSFDGAAASMLASVLVILCLVLLVTELAARGRGRYARVDPGSARPIPPTRLGRRKWAVSAGFAALIGLALGLPLMTLVYWVTTGSSTSFDLGALLGATASSLKLGLGAATLTTLLALPVSILSVRHPSRTATVIERATYLPFALPGIVVALSLIVLSIHYFPSIYGTTELLIVAYAILSLPLALVATRAALAQAPPVHEEIARSLGCRPLVAMFRVTLPRILPGLGAAAALVFLATVTELTATLLLAPIGTQTLATQFWANASSLSYGAAAPYAALMVAISALPTYLLTRRLGGVLAPVEQR